MGRKNLQVDIGWEATVHDTQEAVITRNPHVRVIVVENDDAPDDVLLSTANATIRVTVDQLRGIRDVLATLGVKL